MKLSEVCTIRDVDVKSGVVLLSFNMFGKESYNKPVKDIEVGTLRHSHVEHSLQKRCAFRLLDLRRVLHSRHDIL